MKTFQKLFVFVTVVALFTACQDELAPIQEVNQIQKVLKDGEIDDPVVESVTGSGHVTREYTEGVEAWRTFSLNSRLYESGMLEGTLQLNNHIEEGSSLEAEILCMEFYGDQVLFTCQATASNTPEIVGQYYAFWVSDNGQGKNADPDEICLLYPISENTKNELCAGTPEFVEAYLTLTDVYEVESGNIKVHKSKD